MGRGKQATSPSSDRPPFSVKTIFFDSAGTLVDVPPYSTVWHRIMRDLGLNVTLHNVEKVVRTADLTYGKRYFSYHGKTQDYWTDYLRLILAKLGISGSDQPAIVKEIVRRFQENPWSSPYPETKGVLRSLKRRGFTLGVITNATDEVTWRLERVGLGDYFDSITYSQEARSEKPHPRIFRLALDRMGCKPSQAVHVGDSYESDVVGARRAGIRPILVDRRDTGQSPDCQQITTLAGLEDLVRGWSEK
jgi:putative hydrolase of the HAD superfamily